MKRILIFVLFFMAKSCLGQQNIAVTEGKKDTTIERWQQGENYKIEKLMLISGDTVTLLQPYRIKFIRLGNTIFQVTQADPTLEKLIPPVANRMFWSYPTLPLPDK